MTEHEAFTTLAAIIPHHQGMSVGESAIVGKATMYLIGEGFHTIEFDPLESGGLTLRLYDREWTDNNEIAPKGHVQRSTALLVRAANDIHSEFYPLQPPTTPAAKAESK